MAHMKRTAATAALALGLVLHVILHLGVAARAQDYPSQPVKVVVPFPAGGGTDAIARWFAKGLEARFGQPFVVENRAGSGTTLGAAFVARAAADGYTIMLGTSSTYAIAPNVYKKVPFDPVRDFAPIALVAEVPFVLVVHPALPVTSVKELVALLRSKPGAMSYASAGIGTQHHVNAELLKTLTGIEMTHVPYRGGGPALQDVVAGHVPIYFGDVSTVMPLARAGKVRALALTIAQRLEAFPEVPTMQEAGIANYNASAWQAFVAPAGTPAAIVARLNQALIEIVKSPETRKRFHELGLRPLSSTPDELGAYMTSELVRWGKVVEAAGAKGIE
ncbi:MAG: tripartite tricarboxylate transporter substrate binding protein [Hyphomicrobiales bacterium]|nr:tripartite tricarboxylate transporter substrate binding protein [Hyphomicrobiales bacterium]